MVISSLEIGALEDSFDLDGDGEPDNKLSALRDFSREPLEDAFENFDIVIPIEFFSFPDPGPDDCVKFAVYVGQYRQDRDDDGHQTARSGGDCNDHDPDIYPGAVEIPGNFKDDNCDGRADEDEEGNPSDDTEDRDGDGWTIADGDCDDENPMVNPGMPEICGDGLDNNCDGVADWGIDEDGELVCSPYNSDMEPIPLDPLSFDEGGAPVIAFTAGKVEQEGADLMLRAGPSLFSVNLPITRDINLELQITGASIAGRVVMTPAGYRLEDAGLGGVIDANTADRIRGVEISQISLSEENSLLDAAFANVLGAFLGLPFLHHPDYPDCRTPDIDVDGDGLEGFCDSNGDGAVDVCIDGDGTIIHDEVDSDGNVLVHCTEAVDDKGNLRFVDGISVYFNFDTVPATLPSP